MSDSSTLVPVSSNRVLTPVSQIDLNPILTISLHGSRSTHFSVTLERLPLDSRLCPLKLTLFDLKTVSERKGQSKSESVV